MHLAYALYDLARQATMPAAQASTLFGTLLGGVPADEGTLAFLRLWRASLDMTERTLRHYGRPAYAIDGVEGREGILTVRQETIQERPFCRLLHFRKDTADPGPKVLLVAPLSGHFASLLRGTIEGLLAEHDVFVTDWADAREVPLRHGPFGLDDYVDYVAGHLRVLGGAHVIAVCQPTVPCLAASALMAEDGEAARPLSLTLMGGPIDVAAAPSSVVAYAERHSTAWFEQTLIGTVPWRWPGAGRRVLPHFVQLASFMMMQPERHLTQHIRLFEAMARGDAAEASRITSFYDEYLATLDMPAEFFLDTIERVFRRRDLARGAFSVQGRPVRPEAISDIRLLVIEGGKDDISPPGHTSAAFGLCSSLPESLKHYHLEEGAGHYGLFSGSRFRDAILPRISTFIRNGGDQRA